MRLNIPLNLPLIALTVAAAILAGCGNLGLSRFSDPPLSKEAAAQKRKEHDPKLYDPGHPLADAAGYVDASAYAQQVGAALDRTSAKSPTDAGAPGAPGTSGGDREIMWLDTKAFPAEVGEVADAGAGGAPDEALPVFETSNDAAATVAADAASLALIHATPSTPSTAAAIAAMVKALRQRDGPALNRALAAAAVSVADPQRRLDESFLASLGPMQRQAVERYHRMVLEVYDQIATGSERLDGRTLVERIDAVLGPQPIQIHTIELCRRVRGFGVYEPFDSLTFLAGREHKMIVYVEVDHFTPIETSTDEYEVKLTQEVELYDKDGLMVWRHDPVQIVDQSRNQRRDFFTVQMIALPERLTVGTFHLKVRLNDDHGQSRTERTIDMDIVADQSLVVGK